MAKESEEEEKKIAVLTVTKNKAIVKNIFLVPSSEDKYKYKYKYKEEETAIVTTVGRNPSCDIVLSHPSISRFHLRLLSLPSLSSLSLLDSSSVHGTWVNGVKVEPNVRVELNEGDIIQIGGSSRVYKLHWIPLSQAFDIESSFVSPSYKLAEDKDHEETLEDESGIVYENSQAQHLDEENSEGSDYEVSDEKSRLLLNSEIPLELFLSEKSVENTWPSHNEFDGDINSNSYLIGTEFETSSWLDEILSETEVEQSSPDKKTSVKLMGTEAEQNLDFAESLASLNSHEYSENPCLDTFHLFSEYDIQQMDRENENQQENAGTPLENKNISTIDHEKRTIPRVFSEKLEFEAEISPLPYEIPLESEQTFSEFDVQQLDKENESQEVNIAAPLENKKTSIIDHEKSSGLNVFVEKLGTETEISLLPSDIPLESKNIFSEFDVQQSNKENESQEVNIAAPLENKKTYHEKRSSLSIFFEKLGTETEVSLLPSDIPSEAESLFSELDIQQVDKDFESQEENIATPLENKSTSILNHEKRMSPIIFSEKLESEAEISSLPYGIQVDKDNESQEENIVTPLKNKSTSISNHVKRTSLDIFSEKFESEAEISSLPNGIPLESENIISVFDVQQLDKENESQEVNIATPLENEKTYSFLPIGLEQNADLQESLVALFSHEPFEQSASQNSKIATEVNSQDVNQENESQKENMVTPPLNYYDRESSSSNISSRRCRPSSDLRIHICRSGEKGKITDNIENFEVTMSPLTGLDSGEELYTPDKENFTPKTLEKLRPYSSSSLKIKEKISDNLFAEWYEYNKQFTSDKENNTSGSTLCISSSLENMLASSIEKNSATKLLQRQKITKCCSRSHRISKLKPGIKSSAKRIPFQSLFESSSFSSAEKDCSTKIYNAALEVKEKVQEYKRRWHMVVDATCLLSKESRKALELLRGLKGTQITIPRVVIRELESLNRQGSPFRSKTEAFYALQWIEECTVNTDRGMHIQSSEEEPMPIAQIPPPTTGSRFREMHRRFYDGVASSVLSSWESLFEIVSPTAADHENHVLECALEIGRNTRDAQFILLSNDVTLMIKAMATGLRCETAEEFRGSLVNPFSDRFLWSESSPRGQTWSCADDLILKEKFYGHHTKMEGGDAFKGLKILLAIAT